MRTLVSQMKSSHVENHPTECLVLVKGETWIFFPCLLVYSFGTQHLEMVTDRSKQKKDPIYYNS